MKSIYTFLCTLCLALPASAQAETTENLTPTKELPLIKISSTSQGYNIGQPWEKKQTSTRRGLGVLIGENQIITTAEMAADTTSCALWASCS